jgi:hypothetical protein
VGLCSHFLIHEQAMQQQNQRIIRGLKARAFALSWALREQVEIPLTLVTDVIFLTGQVTFIS